MPNDGTTPGETATPPVVTPTPQPTPPGIEPDTNPGGQPPAMVPSDRLREETEKRREAEAELQKYRDAETERDSQPTPQPSGDDDLDEETVELVRRSAKKLGLVSQSELDARNMQQQVKEDVRTLETQYANTGVPYVHNDIIKFAADNSLPLTSKAALQAAYRSMNFEKLIEVERQRAIQGAHNPTGGSAELPGGGGATPPSEPEVKGHNPRERGLSRIRQARQKITP